VRILCSYCSADKRRDEVPLPAIERYRSDRLQALWRRSLAEGTPLFVLSGRFGLLAATEPIPWYDHLLPAAEVAALAAEVASRLRALGVTAVEYHTANPAATPAVAPYLATIRAACTAAGAALAVVELPGDPA